MSITIKRNTGQGGVASRIQIKLNGKEVGTIMEKKEIEIEIPDGKSNLEVTRFGNKSNKISVKDGDVIEITATAFYRNGVALSLPIGIMMGVILVFLIPDFIYRLIIVAIYLAIIAIAQFFFKLFNIKVVTEKNSQSL